MAWRWGMACTGCGSTASMDRARARCFECGEPLEARGQGPAPRLPEDSGKRRLLGKYREFFPFDEADAGFSLGEGFTPLLRSLRAGPEMGVDRLFFKNETTNPTWSFKDRGTAAGLQHAVTLGYRRIGAVSTGNMAVSVAAYGARSGLGTVVLVSASLPPEKIAPIAVHGPLLVRVEGDYGRLYFDSLRLGEEHGIYFINSDVPLRVEGSKTIAYEICEQLDFEAPDYVIVPTSAGGNLRGIIKGFREYFECGFIDRMPVPVCAQAAGCAPIHEAFHRGATAVERVENPETVAHAIENPYPPSGNEVLRRLRESEGLTAAVEDSEILEAQLKLAGDGIFGQPAGAVPLAAAGRLASQGLIGPTDTVVCVVTGSGLKYTAALESRRFAPHHCRIGELGSLLAKR